MCTKPRNMQRNPASTSATLMAIAEAGAMRGACFTDHSRTKANCEDLAFGYIDPASAWYSEKAIFDKYKEMLGITELTEDNVYDIYRAASKKGEVVGHYTNLFLSKDEVMGVGFCEYGKYRNTSCYNANVMHDSGIYTVEEFENLFNRYRQSLDTDVCQQALQTAQDNLDAAQSELTEKQNQRDTFISSAVSDAKKKADDAKAAADKAENALTAAKEAAAQAETDYKQAAQKQTAAQAALEEKTAQLAAAKTSLTAAQEKAGSAKQADEQAESKLASAKQDKEDADAAVREAETELASRQEALSAAQTQTEKARKAHDEAAALLADLTSEDAINRLEERKDAQAQTVKDADADLTQKQAALQDAQNALAAAQDALKQAQENAAAKADTLTAAQENRKAADNALAKAKDEQAALEEAYAPVREAMDNKDAADRNLADCESRLQAAQQNLADKQAALAKAREKAAYLEGLLENSSKENTADPAKAPASGVTEAAWKTGGAQESTQKFAEAKAYGEPVTGDEYPVEAAAAGMMLGGIFIAVSQKKRRENMACSTEERGE